MASGKMVLYAGRPAYDDLIQGMTGLGHLYQQQSGDVPRYTPLTLCDRTVGLHVAVAVLAGVIEARQSGQGQAIEIPMFEAMAHFVLGDHLGGHSLSRHWVPLAMLACWLKSASLIKPAMAFWYY